MKPYNRFYSISTVFAILAVFALFVWLYEGTVQATSNNGFLNTTPNTDNKASAGHSPTRDELSGGEWSQIYSQGLNAYHGRHNSSSFIIPGGELFLTTLFASNNGFAGNMFDLQVNEPLTITRFEINISDLGGTNTIEIYYRLGTCVGHENGPVGWILLGTDNGVVSNGKDNPTPANIGGLMLEPGQVYGFYVNVASYPSSSMQYTDGGPSIFSNAQMSLTTNCGKGNPAFTGGTFYPRQWNGTIYYTLGAGGGLSISPLEDFSSSGDTGGPFSPDKKTYTLNNIDSNSLSWTAAASASWLSITPASGTLNAGNSVPVEININADANTLPQGTYTDTVTFTNTTSGFSQTRGVQLTVNEPPPPPPQPTNPNPANGAIGVPLNTLLQWNGGGSSALQNGGFETGDFTGWTIVTGSGHEFQPWTLATAGSGNWFGNGVPFEGIYFAQNGFDGEAGLFYDIYQEIAIPAGATSVQLEWSERLQWDTTYGATIARPYEVTLQPAGGGSPLALLFSTTLPPGTTGDTGYVTHFVDLLAAAPGIAGQTIRINFHQFIPETSTGPAQFDIDGVSLTVIDGTSAKRVELGRSFYNKASPMAGMRPSRFPLKDRSAYLKMKEKALASAEAFELKNRPAKPTATSEANPSAASTRTTGNLAHALVTTSDELVIDASDRGWWLDNGHHDASNKNTFTGQDGSGTQRSNSFFVFDLSSVPAGPITNAKLRLEIESYYGTDSSESLTISDVTTPIGVLTSSGTDVAVYNDLGSGNSYGNFTVVPKDVGNVLEITLNSKALIDIGAAAGGFFAVGLKVNDINSPSGDEGVRFSESSEPRVHQLVLSSGDGVPTIYEVYFGKSGLPMNLIYNGPLTTCPPVPYPMEAETTYTWQVIAGNSAGSTPGPVWAFTTATPPGEIEVTDSIAPVNDLNMPFGEVVVGLSRTEHITIANTDPANELIVSDISIGGLGLISSKKPGKSSFTAIEQSAGTATYSQGEKQNATTGEPMKPFGMKWSSGNHSPLAEAILVYADDPIHAAPNTYVDQALQALGLSYTVYYNSNFAGFENALISGGPWDLVIFADDNYRPATSVMDALLSYVNGGGHLIAHSWRVNEGHPLWNAMGVSYVADDTEPPNPVHWWQASHAIFNSPESVPELTVLVGGRYGVYGQYVEPTGEGAAIAGYTIEPASNQAALVIGQQGRTIFRGFMDGQNDADRDSDGKPDGMELWVNMISFVTAGGGFRAENVPQLPVVIPPLGSIDVNVVFEPTEFKEYKSSVVIKSNDEDEPQVNVKLSGKGISDYLSVSPDEGAEFAFAGHPGGPFVPTENAFSLLNITTDKTFNWSVSKDVDWLDVSPVNGTLSPGQSAKVVVGPNASAEVLPEGVYKGILQFTDQLSGLVQSRQITLTVFTSPKIWSSPESLDIAVSEGGGASTVMAIGNTGDGNLNFTLRSREVVGPTMLSQKAVTEMQTSQDNKMVIEYSFNEPVVTKKGNYDQVNIEGLEEYRRVGAPVIPVRPAKILIPFGKKVIAAKAIPLDIKKLPGRYSLPPAQKPYPLNYTGIMTKTEPNAAIYSRLSPWPGEYRREITSQSQRGYQFLVMSLLPLQYTPATGQISYAGRIRLEIELADADYEPVLRPKKNVINKLRRTIDNPGIWETYSGKNIPPEILTDVSPLPPGGPYQYVIITNQSLAAAPGLYNFQTLRDAKTADGLPATIVTTEWIYANYDGTRPAGGSDNQTRIRNFLIDAYQTWGTQYVLLGGTNSIVPARLFWVDSYAGEIDLMPVDMYYGCVEPADCTFDYDSDGLYGEPHDGIGGGDVDLYAEIYVGRATVENAAELEHFVRKTLEYNSTQNEYLSRIAMLGEYLGFGGVSEYATEMMEQIRLGGDYDGYFTYGFENHIQPNFIDFDTQGCLPAGCCWPLYDAPGYDWPKEYLTCLMNGGIHVFNHLGHANQTYCMKLYNSDLALLQNSDYFFVYSQGCEPGWFDSPNCFAEVLTSMEHGAFAAVMNARFGWGMGSSTDGPSQRYDRRFWDAVLGDGILEIGRANQDSKEHWVSDMGGACMRWCYYELNLFGDPAQKLRFQTGCNWLACTPEGGIVTPNDQADVNVVFSPGDLPLGTYYAEIDILSNDPYDPLITVPVTMIVKKDELVVTPQESVVFTGIRGGPFKPNAAIYTLFNNGTTPLDWKVTTSAPWLDAAPTNGTLPAQTSADVVVSLNSQANYLTIGDHNAVVTFTNITSGSAAQERQVTLTVLRPDYFTELFNQKDNDLRNQSMIFTPDGSSNFYSVCRFPVIAFPTDPAGGTVLSLQDDDYKKVTLTDGDVVSFYGWSYNSLYVGSNGYITFDTGDTAYAESFDQHFKFKRISALFDDLSPNLAGSVSWKQLDDRLAVTFLDVPEYHLYNANSFQIELFFNGVIRITHLNISAADGLAGLSQGNGTPSDFVESNLSAYDQCTHIPADFEPDGDVDLADFAILASHWLVEDCGPQNNWCHGSDFKQNGNVNMDDLAEFSKYWLDSLTQPDGNVSFDFTDFAVLASHWLAEDCGPQNNWCNGSDFKRDGNVNMDDLAEFSENWLH